jgi:hypothetical protein
MGGPGDLGPSVPKPPGGGVAGETVSKVFDSYRYSIISVLFASLMWHYTTKYSVVISIFLSFDTVWGRCPIYV